MPRRSLIDIPNIKREAYINVGKEISKKFLKHFKFKNNLFEDVIKKKPRSLNVISKYIGLAHVFYNICVNEGEKHIIKLDLILDWERFLSIYKTTFERAWFQTQKAVTQEEIGKMIQWIIKPDFVFSKQSNMILEARTFHCPNEILNELNTFAKELALKAIHDEREYCKLFMRKRALGISKTKDNK